MTSRTGRIGIDTWIDYPEPLWQAPRPIIESTKYDVEERQGSGLKNLSKHLLVHQRAALALKGNFRETGFGFSLAFFEHVHSHRNVYHAIVGRQNASQIFPEMQSFNFVAGALMSVVTWWLDERSKLSPAKRTRYFGG